MHMAQEHEDKEDESSLLIVLANKHAHVLLQGTRDSPIDDMWYLDIGASSQMTGIKTFYHSLDESYKGMVRFDDGSSIMYERKGEVHVDSTNGESMIFENVFYIPKLKTNIFIFRNHDSQGCDIHLRDGFLTLHDGQGRLLTKTPNTRGNTYLLKLDGTRSSGRQWHMVKNKV